MLDARKENAFDACVLGRFGLLEAFFRITDDVEDIVAEANRIGHPKINENFYDGFREASKIAQQ